MTQDMGVRTPRWHFQLKPRTETDALELFFEARAKCGTGMLPAGLKIKLASPRPLTCVFEFSIYSLTPLHECK